MVKQKPVERVAAPARGGRGSYWAEVLREWSASGQTQVDFCRDRGVSGKSAMLFWGSSHQPQYVRVNELEVCQ
ncbi:MAG: hypothetical protein HC897_05970 [Thermoanaerobaculia bacterium]|nr:hypothetical protein [Thermoanaerobaculia bacterium]